MERSTISLRTRIENGAHRISQSDAVCLSEDDEFTNDVFETRSKSRAKLPNALVENDVSKDCGRICVDVRDG